MWYRSGVVVLLGIIVGCGDSTSEGREPPTSQSEPAPPDSSPLEPLPGDTLALDIDGFSEQLGAKAELKVTEGQPTVRLEITGSRESDVLLLDVTPHSMGIKVTGDRMSVIIPRNTTIPTRERKVFSTTDDNQDFVAIEVYQGEDAQAPGNRMLGRFILGDLPKRPAGQVRVEVSFNMDADGILHVAATELTTGNATTIMIQASSGLSPAELQRLSGAHSQRRAVP